MKAKKPRLSCDAFLLIRDALEFRKKHLTTLHWQAVALGATDPLYRNIAIEQGKLDKAGRELCEVYEAQFPK